MRHTRIIVTHYGGPDVLRVVEEECPEPKDGEVRVRVLAAGVSLPDVMAREGVHPETPPVPFTPGWDLVGVVDRLGDGASGIERGTNASSLLVMVGSPRVPRRAVGRTARASPPLRAGQAGPIGREALQEIVERPLRQVQPADHRARLARPDVAERGAAWRQQRSRLSNRNAASAAVAAM